jgi:acetylornithine deacetylase/succinyl-diaminopimelate desuccinylase-like protein
VTEELIEQVIQRAIEIQQIPAPTFKEQQRAEFVKQAFEQEGLKDVSMDEIGNVFARLPGRESEPFLVVSAHTDTVFPEDTDLKINRAGTRVAGPGIGDNSVGVAGLFGLLWSLRKDEIKLPGDLWLVANVCEEGLGDLVGMRRVVKRFGAAPLGYVVLEGLALGRLYHRGLGVKRYKVSVKTRGGHSWIDYGSPSAIHILTELAQQILSIRLAYRKRSTINIGRISGGVSINTIAPYASMELDLRSESGRVLNVLSRKVEDVVRFAKRPEVELAIEVIGHREFGEIDPEHSLVQLGIRALTRQGIDADLLIGSTDANVPLSQGIPAICIGLTNGGAAHTEEEFMHTTNLIKGLAQLTDVVQEAFEILT